MGQREERNDEIRRFIVGNVGEHAGDISALVASRFGISRQAATRHVQRLVEAGVLAASGATRDRTYSLRPIRQETIASRIGRETQEDRARPVETRTAEDVCEALADLPPEALRLAADFIAFLRSRYPSEGARRKAGPGALQDEPFVGMWRDRTDLEDAPQWVRELRRREWLR